MHSIIKVNSTEFSADIFEQIRAIVAVLGHSDITIRVEPKKAKRKQTREAYFAQLDKAVENINNNHNLVSFQWKRLKSRHSKTMTMRAVKFDPDAFKE